MRRDHRLTTPRAHGCRRHPRRDQRDSLQRRRDPVTGWQRRRPHRPVRALHASHVVGAALRHVNIDGSSTVYPITEAVAEEFQKANPGVKVTVGVRRHRRRVQEVLQRRDRHERRVAADQDDRHADAKSEGDAVQGRRASSGSSSASRPTPCRSSSTRTTPGSTCLTTAQLKKIWDEGSTVTTWTGLDPAFPAEPIKLFGPGADSGTFDYFTEVINGKAKQSRSDYTPSEDDNALVTGVAGDKDALGYFGFAYLEENLDKIKPVAIDSGGGCVEPSAENVNDGTYKPLARPLFIYPSVKALAAARVRGLRPVLPRQRQHVSSTRPATSRPCRMSSPSRRRTWRPRCK